MLDEEELRGISGIFSALGGITRLKIIELISETTKPLHIKALARLLKKDYAAVYRHIRVLEKTGLIGIYEVGRSRVIYLNNTEIIEECINKVKKLYHAIGLKNEKIVYKTLSYLRHYDMCICPSFFYDRKNADVRVQIFHGVSLKNRRYDLFLVI